VPPPDRLRQKQGRRQQYTGHHAGA
jgi:hypothetical protein